MSCRIQHVKPPQHANVPCFVSWLICCPMSCSDINHHTVRCLSRYISCSTQMWTRTINSRRRIHDLYICAPSALHSRHSLDVACIRLALGYSALSPLSGFFRFKIHKFTLICALCGCVCMYTLAYKYYLLILHVCGSWGFSLATTFTLHCYLHEHCSNVHCYICHWTFLKEKK